MTHMPVAHRVLSTERIRCQQSTKLDKRAIISGIRSAVHFETQVASELYWCGKQNDYSLESDFGPLRLPYPTVWMEWRLPRRIVVNGKEGESSSILVGCLLHEVKTSADTYRINTVSVFAAPNPTEPASILPMTSYFDVTDQGKYITGSYMHAYDNDLELKAIEAWGGALKGHENVAFLALNLINCKNVTTERAGSVHVRRSGSKKRRREPRIEFHTIVLPGHESSSAPSSRRENQGVMPVHRVRGHFKTFTDEAPLLGKFIGTYWWGWQVRGNKDNGMVVSDYKVGVA